MKVGQCVKYCHQDDGYDEWSIGVVTRVHESGRFHVIWTDSKFPTPIADFGDDYLTVGSAFRPRTLFDDLDLIENGGRIEIL